MMVASSVTQLETMPATRTPSSSRSFLSACTHVVVCHDCSLVHHPVCSSCPQRYAAIGASFNDLQHDWSPVLPVSEVRHWLDLIKAFNIFCADFASLPHQLDPSILIAGFTKLNYVNPFVRICITTRVVWRKHRRLQIISRQT